MRSMLSQIEQTTSVEKRLAIRDRIFTFEQFLSESEGAFFGDTENTPVKHSFSEGIYVREIFLPKGLTCTGKIHKHQHPSFIMSGDVTVITEHTGRERLIAPACFISPPGTKRVVIANEDTIWITVHPNPDELRDPEDLEDMIIAKGYEELPEGIRKGLICHF